MRADELERRLALGEDSVTEFKSVVRNNHDVDGGDLAKAICALANTKGGLLLLGVEDDGTVTGLGSAKQADTLMRKASQICSDTLQPALVCSMVKVELRGVIVLAVQVPAFSPDRPYSIGGRFYVRDANQSRETRRDELKRLLQSADYHFDEQPVEGTSLKNLEPEAVQAFVRRAYEEMEPERDWTRWLPTLKCVDRGGVPTVAGILLFGREPQQWLLDARISVAVFPGKQMGDDFEKKEIGGRLFDQIDAAVDYLELHHHTPARVEGLERRERRIPRKVLREMVLNAVTHRDYRAASQVRLFVYSDRVECINPGGLLNQLTLESIKEGGLTQHRNPVLASLLSRGSRRENLGMCVVEIFRLMRQEGFPAPELSVVGGHFKVVLRLEGAADHG